MNHPMAAQIADTPVRWRPWGQDACTEAARRGVPLAVLVGDTLDAWTAAWLQAIHGDAGMAALLEDAFVPVAAERSDHPGLAAMAQQVLALVADASGVPCLLILLPGDPPVPLGAIPYGPVRDADGRKGLARVLLECAEGWTVAHDDLAADADRLRTTLDGLPFALAGGRFDPRLALELAEAQLMGQAHAIEGGFGATPDGAVALPRWPRPEALRLLARMAGRPDAAPSLRAHLERSLTALAAGGIHDQLGGGFHRASTDAAWTEPLWEQRLGDQALIARAFLDGHRLLGHGLFREVAEGALAWAVGELALGDARWAAGWHAMPAGAAAGSYQRWSDEQAAEVVGRDGARILAARFGIATEPGALAVRGQVDPPAARRLPELTARLAAARAERPTPPLDRRDDLAAHGHLLGALHAATGLPDPRPDLAAARDALLARLSEMAPASGRPRAAAAVALALAEAGRTQQAARWLESALADARDGLLPWDGDPLVAIAPIDAEDTADGPSAAACAILALRRLGRSDEADAMLRAHAGLLMKAPSVACGMCLGIALHQA